ncbi:MAG: ABC transporter ATP-binding protein, partial [Acidimicrobiales bacterium]
EWQRSPEQTAAVLAVGPVAAAAVLLFGAWYHRLDHLLASRRADAVGIQLLAAGALVFIGGLSFTYIGLIVSWGLAGGALGLAAAGLDAAVFPSLAPRIRRRVAARQVGAAGLGAATAMLFNAWVVGGWSDQWKIAVTGIPLVAVGFVVRRHADSAWDENAGATAAAATSVPRRVEALDGTRPTMLRVADLDVAYGSVQVLFGVDVTVDQGEVVALLGTNGAGKTTLLRAISGLEPTLGGRILYAGLDVTKTRPTWRVGMGLHQIVGGEAVVDPLTVADNLRLFSHTVPVEDREPGIERALELFPILNQRLEQRAATLSGGEKQMLALSKAIIVRPRVLLIDEFSLGLAPLVVSTLLPVVRGLADDGAAVLLVEQSVNVALSVADRAYVMEKGEIGFAGEAESLRARPELLRAAYLEGLTKALDQ